MTDTLWLLRHGNREDFVDERWRETAERPHDPDLSPDGIEQARRTGRALRAEGIGAIYASPFLRTVCTAALVAEEIGAPVRLEWGCAEWMNADWFCARRHPPELTRRPGGSGPWRNVFVRNVFVRNVFVRNVFVRNVFVINAPWADLRALPANLTVVGERERAYKAR